MVFFWCNKLILNQRNASSSIVRNSAHRRLASLCIDSSSFSGGNELEAPVTLYRITSERRNFYTGLGCCLHYASVIRYVPRSTSHSALLVVRKVIRYVPYWEMPSVINKSGTLRCNMPVLLAPKLNSLEFHL